jgi:hypothetical protein
MNKELELDLTATISDNILFVNFDKIKSPFRTTFSQNEIVDDYYMIVVKYKHRSTFTIANAEILLQDKLYKVRKHLIPDGDTMFDHYHIRGILDSDGDSIDINDKYSVFIFAVYNKVYQKMVNNYENFLSTPSLIKNLP